MGKANATAKPHAPQPDILSDIAFAHGRIRALCDGLCEIECDYAHFEDEDTRDSVRGAILEKLEDAIQEQGRKIDKARKALSATEAPPAPTGGAR
jgi:hypothetical protein